MSTTNYSYLQRTKEAVAETLDDLSNLVLESKELSVDEAADLVLNELDEWTTYYKSRFEFYENLKSAIGKRIS